MNVLSRDDAPRHREQAPYEQRFYPLLARRENEALALPVGVGLLTLACLGGWGWWVWGAWKSAALHAVGLGGILASQGVGVAAVARRNGIPLRRPLFLPCPWLGGSLGLLPRPVSPFKTRSDWLEIALAGPAALASASFVVGLWGVPELELAAECGRFLAFLNLLPLPGFAGGHAWSSLLRRQLWLGRLVCLAACLAGLAWTGQFGWLAWVVLLLAFRPRLAPPLNPFQRLAWPHLLLALGAGLLLVWLARPWPF